MPDFTASTKLRDTVAANLATLYYFVTLHDATGGFVASDVYAAGVRGELATALGYTRGGKPLSLVNTNGVLDGPDAVWTATGGILSASNCAVWMNTTNTINGAGLLCVKNSAQSSSDGQPMTGGIVNPITIPTPA